jgi:hypothetical protein
MIDKAWEKVVPALALGIRQMPVIRDHPNWWVCTTLDGFGSHVSVHSALKIFHDHKIMIVKEEADTFLLNQSYDQHVATCDKINVRTFLDLIRRRLPVICQWNLIAACIAVFLSNASTGAWKTSFKRVNLHPHFRLSFEDWICKIKQHIDTGIANFQRRDNFWFNAMPAWWRNMTVECRHK